MSNDLTLFHFEDDRTCFEDVGVKNGVTLWHEDVVREALGYQGDDSFRKAIGRAIQACISLGIEQAENFVHKDGKYCLTRFACYLVAMNGDPKKPQVAAAQVYFAAVAETFQSHLDHVDGIERILIRDEVSDGQKSLSSTAKRHGLRPDGYGLFLDAGYRGMYNMSLTRLAEFKGIAKKGEFLDRIGKNELAANLFRITQTEAKIKNQNIRGQGPLERAAHDVGKTVRSTMQEISGTTPEHLPAVEHIKDVKKGIKGTGKTLNRLDSEE